MILESRVRQIIGRELSDQRCSSLANFRASRHNLRVRRYHYPPRTTTVSNRSALRSTLGVTHRDRTSTKVVFENALRAMRCVRHQGAHGGVSVSQVQPPLRGARRIRRAPPAVLLFELPVVLSGARGFLQV